jgi:hypothetical protein
VLVLISGGTSRGQIDNSTRSLSADIWHSLSFPVLETINGEQFFEGSVAEGLYIGTAGNQLNVGFPKLSNCSTVAIYGTIGG